MSRERGPPTSGEDYMVFFFPPFLTVTISVKQTDILQSGEFPKLLPAMLSYDLQELH